MLLIDAFVFNLNRYYPAIKKFFVKYPDLMLIQSFKLHKDLRTYILADTLQNIITIKYLPDLQVNLVKRNAYMYIFINLNITQV